jgi:3-methyladenine DNA glycosylase AlkC
MAEPLKYMYNPQFFERLCPFLQEAFPDFPCRRFIYRVFNKEWPELELKQRVRHITHSLHEFLPANFIEAASALTRLSRNLLNGGMREQAFACMFIPDYIEVYGMDHPEESLNALEQITELVSAEFAIRSFIIKHPATTMKKMLEWSTNIKPNVRRLASEGCRPRLPWAPALPGFKKDPASVLTILENLKCDDSEYVRRSVANNLNDIAKDHPDLVLRIARRWLGNNPNTDWIVKHACRTLLKKGDTKVLNLHGFNSNDKARVQDLRLSKRKVKVGEDLHFDFTLKSLEKKACNFRIEYAIDYVSSTGKTSTKIFKVAEKTVAPHAEIQFNRKQSFRDLTTRKHYKGLHQLYIIANGKKLIATEFSVQ